MKRSCILLLANLKNCKAAATSNTGDNQIEARPVRGNSAVTAVKDIFSKDCIFCNKEGKKKVKIKGISTTEATIYFNRGGGKIVFDAAEDKGDHKLLGRIGGLDLFSCEAKYHPSCKDSYVHCLYTVDLGAYRQVMLLVFSHPEIYSSHIILLGPFHINKAYIKALGKKMRGSGIEDILIDAQLTTSGHINAILRATDYNRAHYIIKVLTEALGRLLLEEFTKECELDPGLIGEVDTALYSLIHSPNKDVLESTLSNEAVTTYIAAYQSYKDEIRGGKKGLTPQFWVSV